VVTAPTPQHTAPLALPTQSVGPLHSQVMEPAIGQVIPPAWQLELDGVVLGASQHSCPAVQWTEPVGVNGQNTPASTSG